uniref:Uncharacterized protein n=1 Tax=Amphora coffeiformis TaxID=265554 RepID=A0A7S3L7G6_9STRA|mmetsp:Transcript_11941/g.22955  ORF Transcript_11941/g.22955 Transcript_11941/m.22955 type:complete len:357 (-) Transcript_11941:140-1210(-)
MLGGNSNNRNINTGIFVSAVAALAVYQWTARSFSRRIPKDKADAKDAIVVTGSHTGIGKAAALALAREGFTVFCGVRKLEHGEELLATAREFDIDTARVKPVLLDVTNSAQITAAVKTVAAFVGDRGLYGLFNNAGIGPADPNGNCIEDYSMDLFRQTMEVNYFGMIAVTKAFLPMIRTRRGRILTNSSLSGLFAGPFFGHYSSSKFAVEGLCDALRRELHPFGVSVSLLEPGFVMTPMTGLIPGLIKNHKGTSIYSAYEMQSFRLALKEAPNAAPTTVTNQAVIHAMRAPIPQPRYVVGYLSGAMKFLSLLPTTWADAMIRSSSSNASKKNSNDMTTSEKDLERLSALSKNYFKL